MHIFILIELTRRCTLRLAYCIVHNVAATTNSNFTNDVTLSDGPGSVHWACAEYQEDKTSIR